MSSSLFDLTVPTYLQILGAVDGFLEKGRLHCQQNNIDLAEIVETRIYPDMFPFRFQIHSLAHHTLGAIEGIKRGSFSPRRDFPLHDYAGLQRFIQETLAGVQKLSAAEIDSFAGRDVRFENKDVKLPFTVENFLLSFSLPNLYFHATTAYDILRSKGVPLGKRDFLGKMRLKK